MPEDWKIDMRRWRDGQCVSIYESERSIVFCLPLKANFRIAEATRHDPAMIRQSMNTFRYIEDCRHGWNEEPIFFFPWRAAGDFPFREAGKRHREHRPPKGRKDEA